MPAIDSYLFFDGQCAEAMRFYERTLGGKLQALMKYSDSPEPADEACAGGGRPDPDRVMHAALAIDGRMLMASDMPTPGQHPKMAGFGLSLHYPTAAEARRAFDALAAGGSVTMPMQQTFFADAFGMLTDRFGTPWMVGGGGRTA
jgi:PhnB protein